MLAYRLLTGDDSSAFCHKVTEALYKGWSLQGDPIITFNPTTGQIVTAQAVVKEVDAEYSPEMKLGQL